MRSTVGTLILLLSIPGSSGAQFVDRPNVLPPPPPRFATPSWAIQPLIGPRIELPPIGLPLAPVGNPPPVVNNKIDRAGHGQGARRGTPDGRPSAIDARRWTIDHRRSNAYPVYPWVPAFYWPSSVVFVPDAMTSYQAEHALMSEAAPARATGGLVLDVQPGSAQVFVDSYYVGTPDDFGARGGVLHLEPGPHHVALEASGYHSTSFSVQINAEDPISYRAVLTPLQQQDASVSQPPIVKRRFYLIPGCYMGDVPPKDAHLPANCDLSRTQTFDP